MSALRKTRRSGKTTYKPHRQNQRHLIPPNADELIPQDHPIRLVNEIIDEMEGETVFGQIKRNQQGGLPCLARMGREYHTKGISYEHRQQHPITAA